MTDALVQAERHPGGVVLLRLQRPPLNPLSEALLGDLGAAARELAADDGVHAVVVAGSEKAFAAGADISEFGSSEDARRIEAAFRAAFDAVAAIPRPVIAAIRGFALGGGLELALACDLRVTADSARLGQPEILLGIIPGAGGTQRLPRLVGISRAKEMVFTGRLVDADEALSIGLVNRVVPSADVHAAAVDLAVRLARGPALALRAAKEAIDRGVETDLSTGLDIERVRFAALFATDDQKLGMAAFVEKRPAEFTGN